MFAKKLKVLKEDIIQWNRQEFSNVGCKKKELLGALESLDAKDGVLGLTETEMFEKRSEIANRASSFFRGDLMEIEIEDVVH